jgi:hypothetical protein
MWLLAKLVGVKYLPTPPNLAAAEVFGYHECAIVVLLAIMRLHNV